MADAEIDVIREIIASHPCTVTQEVWPDMIHAWHLFYWQVAAGRHALAAVGAFILMLG
jgi:monoterpene epsilon-lactone hydrolase